MLDEPCISSPFHNSFNKLNKNKYSFNIFYLKGTVQALLDKKDDREIQDEVFKQLGEYLQSQYRGNDT